MVVALAVELACAGQLKPGRKVLLNRLVQQSPLGVDPSNSHPSRNLSHESQGAGLGRSQAAPPAPASLQMHERVAPFERLRKHRTHRKQHDAAQGNHPTGAHAIRQGSGQHHAQ